MQFAFLSISPVFTFIAQDEGGYQECPPEPDFRHCRTPNLITQPVLDTTSSHT